MQASTEDHSQKEISPDELYLYVDIYSNRVIHRCFAIAWHAQHIFECISTEWSMENHLNICRFVWKLKWKSSSIHRAIRDGYARHLFISDYSVVCANVCNLDHITLELDALQGALANIFSQFPFFFNLFFFSRTAAACVVVMVAFCNATEHLKSIQHWQQLRDYVL